ncbi:hypothetical protein SAMN05428969_1236 [Devosia sp. YR412]|uniref:hypothetical protein n=1 Tax=Devosia sp. YR412 TaxID=1881030 RepID=UPI0008ACA157|nr:hypothetical protein [Devosia sp. YR412]SEP86089.1 hypothetical protein SAMN05428969_1236 [Devosia sp. YR412]
MEWWLFAIPVLMVGSLALLISRTPQGRINRRRNDSGDHASGDSGSTSSHHHGHRDGDGSTDSADSGGGDGGGGGGD